MALRQPSLLSGFLAAPGCGPAAEARSRLTTELLAGLLGSPGAAAATAGGARGAAPSAEAAQHAAAAADLSRPYLAK